MLFVIPCKFDKSRPVIYEAVTAIQHHHDNPPIVVVDSDSDDKSYLKWCRDRGCIVADIGNHGYAHGAFAFAVRGFPNAEHYALIFDSLIVTANLDHLESQPLTTIRHWSNSEHDWGWDRNSVHLSVWGNQQLHRMGIPFPTSYHGILGPAMFAQRSVIDRLLAIGYYDTQIYDAFEHCGLERVAGICLEALDYSVTDSLQGTHYSHDSHYSEEYIRKINMARV
jgi:hypothetical protein